MSAWASASPVIGTGSLDGIAIGSLMSGACALAITAPRRARRPSAARGGVQAADRNGWLCEHVMAAEAVGFGLAAQVAMAVASAAAAKAVRIEAAGTGLAAAEVAGPEATAEAVETARTGMACTGMAGAGLADESFGAEAERLARPEEVGAKRTGCSAGGQDGRAPGGYRSRHRRGDPIPFGAPRDGVSPGSTSEQSAFPGIVALQSPFPGGAVRSNAFADSAFPRSAFADSVLPRTGSACRRSRHSLMRSSPWSRSRARGGPMPGARRGTRRPRSACAAG
jgi:hypothetical protein